MLKRATHCYLDYGGKTDWHDPIVVPGRCLDRISPRGGSQLQWIPVPEDRVIRVATSNSTAALTPCQPCIILNLPTGLSLSKLANTDDLPHSDCGRGKGEERRLWQEREREREGERAGRMAWTDGWTDGMDVEWYESILFVGVKKGKTCPLKLRLGVDY